MTKGEAIFIRLFELECIKNKSQYEKEEYRILKKIEREDNERAKRQREEEKQERMKYYGYDEEDGEEGTDWLNQAESVGMTLTVFGWQ